MSDFLVLRGEGRRLEEDESQHGKHEGLDESDEDLEKEEWERHEERHEMEHHDKEDLPGKDIAEETEGEGDRLADFRDKLENSHRGPDAVRLVKGAHEELPRVGSEAERGDAGELDRDDGDQGEGQGEVEVGRSRPEKRDDGMTPLAVVPGQADGVHTREEADPVGREDEEEYGRNERKELEGLLAVLGHRLDEIEEHLKYYFKEILHPARHLLPIADEYAGTGDDASRHDRPDEERVGHREPPDREKLFGCNRDFHIQKRRFKAPLVYQRRSDESNKGIPSSLCVD